jgi:hypothetical protein
MGEHDLTDADVRAIENPTEKDDAAAREAEAKQTAKDAKAETTEK